VRLLHFIDRNILDIGFFLLVGFCMSSGLALIILTAPH
jgi:hypothetical protein